jgi:hypothetical protein
MTKAMKSQTTTLRARQPRGGRRRSLTALAVAALGLLPLAASCTSAQTAGKSSSYLIIESLTAAPGATPSQQAGVLSSDVLTFVKKTVNGQETLVPTVFGDGAEARFRLGMKDPGTAQSPNNPTSSNFITVTRYHVVFIRSDGRNTQGVDVPFAFDGAATGTVTDAGGGVGFTIVRNQAKEEAPLQALIGGGGARFISTIAEVTFYGTDQAGREVSVVGRISVNFADWGDPV